MKFFLDFKIMFEEQLNYVKGGNLDNLSTCLKNYRLENGYTRTKLSDELNLSLSTIAKYEEGERTPSLETLVKISQLFNVSLDNLLS